MRVTAALDSADAPVRTGTPESRRHRRARLALAAHGLAPELTEKILAAALPFDDEDPLVALSSALATLYAFSPLAAEEARRVSCSPARPAPARP